MKITDFEGYTGTNPKPADYSEFWASAVEEMLSQNSNVSFIPASFKANNSECYDMYFTGVGGAKIHCKHVRPKNAAGKLPAVLSFHGYGWRSDEFSSLLSWSGEGYAIFALDCRGQSGLSEYSSELKGFNCAGQFTHGLADKDPSKLLFRKMFLDTAQLANIVSSLNFIDTDRIFAYGNSQGGALTVACSALAPDIIKKSAIIFPFLSDFKKVWEMGVDGTAYAEIKNFIRNYDPLHEHEDEIFEKLGYIDVHHLAPRIKADVLFLTGLSDSTCPPITQMSVYNSLTCKKNIIAYPDFGHENLPDSTQKIMEFFNSQ